MKPLLLAASVLFTSCSIVPTPVKNDNGGSTLAVLVGGKGALSYNADGSMAYTYNNVQSFQHLMQAATAVGMTYIGYLESLAQQVTDRYMAGQITLQQKNAALASIEQAKIAAGVTTSTTLNPNVIPK